MGIIIFFFIALLVPIFFILKNPKISLMQKSLMIFSVIVVSVGILCYVFITGFERGRDPKILDYEIESQNNDSLELQKLVRDVYKWRETENSKPDFDVYLNDKNDTIYAGLDSKMHKERLKELSKTNLFSQEFLDNYNKIATNIDEKMKKKSAIYYVGELPPFGNDANPWCNCQDNPDNYWKTLTIKKLNIKGNKADFVWTWGDDFEYKTKAKKENSVWEISYLEGFDFNQFFKQ